MFFSDQLIIDVDTDCEDGELYWTDVYSGKISKSKLDGSEETVVIKGRVELSLISHHVIRERSCCGRDRMVVGFTTTCAVSVYHH